MSPYGQNNSTNWPAVWRRKRWFGQAYKIGIRIFEYYPEQLDQDVVAVGGVFTRASAASYYLGAEGDRVPRTIEFAAVDEIRDDHWVGWRDLSTEEPLRRGSLIERAATNVATYSEDFTNAVWSATGVNVTGDQLAIPVSGEPDTGDLVDEDASTGEHFISRTFTTTGPFAFSVFVKRVGAGQKVRLRISADGNAANSCELTFDETDLEYAVTESGTCEIRSAGVDRNISSWHRLMLGVESPGAASYEVKISVLDPDGNESYTGLPGTGFGMWGAHAETEEYVTSYIRSLAATAGTRAADLLYFSWPLTNQAIPMSVLLRFQDLGTYSETDGVYDQLGSDVFAQTPKLSRYAKGDGTIAAIHANSQGFNEAIGPQQIVYQYMIDSMTRLYEDGILELEQSVEGQANVVVRADANLIGIEDWAGTPDAKMWVGGVNGGNMGAIVLFQLRMVDNPKATFIADQKPVLLTKGLKINPDPSFKDYAFVEDQAQDVFLSEQDPDAQAGYAVIVDDDTNALLIEEELGFWFIDDGI